MALIVTLGLLTVITLAIVAFAITMRIEHLAAQNTASRTMARQYADVGLSEAMGTVDYILNDSVSSYPVQGWFDPTNSPATEVHYTFQNMDCLGSFNTNDDASIPLFRGMATNLLPGTLAAQASQISSGWINILETNETTGATGIKAGRVAYLIANLSGMMDVHALNADRYAVLKEPQDGSRAYNYAYQFLLTSTGAYQRVFLTQPDLHAANGGAVSNLITFSYDPGPDVYITATNGRAFSTRAFTNELANRFNINPTNFSTATPGYASSPACLQWISSVSNLLGDAGLSAPDQAAWNILNYIDTGRLPVVAAGPTPAFRTGYGVKDVPLINEVLLAQVPGALTNHYCVSVEAWYPFVPHAAPANCKLWVGVYTNAGAVRAEFAAFSNNHDAPPTPLGFEIALPIMNYGASNEFVVASTTNAGANLIAFEQVIVDSYGPPLVTHTNYLPVSTDNPVWIWPRVYVDDSCVDESLVDATSGASVPVWTWTDVGDIQFADPRANDTLASASFTNAPTLAATNANCTVPSLPLVHADAPMNSAGELRYIYAPGMVGARIDFTTAIGGACRDRFTTHETNAPVHGLVQANTPYTNIWQALLSDVTIGWTNQLHPSDFFSKIGTADSTKQTMLASSVANALLNTGGRGWVCNEEMFPVVGSNLLSTAMLTNNADFGMDARAICGDILAGLADRVSFRGNTFLVIVCGQRLSPLGRVLADQRAAFTVVRDAFTGRWVVDHVVWLTE